MLIGKVNMTKIGFITVFIIPKTIATTSADFKSATLIPGRRYDMKKIAIAFIKRVTISCIKILYQIIFGVQKNLIFF